MGDWRQAWETAQYVAIHGSEAYGLATEESDLDLKGAFIPRRDALLGYRNLPPEQVEFSPDAKTPGRLLGPHDAVVFSLQKLCRLGAACNPNVVEMLFVEERHIMKMTPLGERIRELGPQFLSLRARQTFGEYARGQLRRMEQHRRWLRTFAVGHAEPSEASDPSIHRLCTHHVIHEHAGEGGEQVAGKPSSAFPEVSAIEGAATVEEALFTLRPGGYPEGYCVSKARVRSVLERAFGRQRERGRPGQYWRKKRLSSIWDAKSGGRC